MLFLFRFLLVTFSLMPSVGWGQSRVVRVECGRTSAIGSFGADASGSAATGAVITAGVAMAAPERVYQTIRSANSFTYNITGLFPNTVYKVRLHLNEPTVTAAGQRVFDVVANGAATPLFNDVDIYALAGGQLKAVVRDAMATSNGSGALSLAFSRINATSAAAAVAGIEVFDPNIIASSYRTGTLRDRDGQKMRGTRMVVGKAFETTSTAVARDVRNWARLKALGLNTVRLCWVDPWYKFNGFQTSAWSVAEALPVLDECVANARATGMNVIINYHNSGEQNNFPTNAEATNLELVDAFWTAVAPRYKDSDLVFYELVNEPVFSSGPYMGANFFTRLSAIYSEVRAAAPEREIIMFAFNQVGFEMSEAVDFYRDLMDWNKTSVAYHLYGPGDASTAISSVNVKEMAATYPLICTEWDYPTTDPALSYIKTVDGFVQNSQALEVLGDSWIDWAGWEVTNTTAIETILFPHAAANGYAWNTGPALENASHLYRINAGGSRVPDFTADQFAAGGSVINTATAINLSGVSYAAPAAVYQTARAANSFSYQFAGLDPNKTHTVRLHFAEWQLSAANARVMTVQAVGATMVSLTGLDVFAAAGGAARALVRELFVKPTAGGVITVQFTRVSGSAAMVSGVEVLEQSGSVLVDRDDDGMSDVFEFRFGGNATGLGASADSDGDGFNNLLEFYAGTSPLSITSMPQYASTRTAGGLWELTWTASSDARRVLPMTWQRGTNLQTDWGVVTAPVTGVVVPAAGLETYKITVPTMPGAAREFFRFVVTP